MTKADLINKMQEQIPEATKTSLATALDASLDIIAQSLAQGETITFTGFGTLKTQTRAARQGRNPRTGAPVNIPAQKVVKFTPGKNLKEAVKG